MVCQIYKQKYRIYFQGGLRLQPETKLCLINCSDGTSYTIRAGIKALLIEVNTNLVEKPELLTTSREKRGYLAIIIPPAILQNFKNKIPREFGVPVRHGSELPMIKGNGDNGNDSQEKDNHECDNDNNGDTEKEKEVAMEE